MCTQRLAHDFLYEPVRITVGKVGGASRTVTQQVRAHAESQSANQVIAGLTVVPPSAHTWELHHSTHDEIRAAVLKPSPPVAACTCFRCR